MGGLVLVGLGIKSLLGHYFFERLKTTIWTLECVQRSWLFYRGWEGPFLMMVSPNRFFRASTARLRWVLRSLLEKRFCSELSCGTKWLTVTPRSLTGSRRGFLRVRILTRSMISSSSCRGRSEERLLVWTLKSCVFIFSVTVYPERPALRRRKPTSWERFQRISRMTA